MLSQVVKPSYTFVRESHTKRSHTSEYKATWCEAVLVAAPCQTNYDGLVGVKTSLRWWSHGEGGRWWLPFY